MVRKNRNGFKLFAVFFLYNACAGPVHEEEGEDASVVVPIEICNEYTDLMNDVGHCGKCYNNCSTSGIGDKCVEGQCICNEATDDEGNPRGCTKGVEECKLGSCAKPDPDTEEEDPEAITCEFDHQCDGNRLCVLGICSEIPCADMNGQPQVRSCYTGAGNTFENLPCHMGYTVCFGGHWGPCLEEVIPVAEDGLFSCDGFDNDCDGCPDGNWVNGVCVIPDRRLIDILFIYDKSGSMNSKCLMTKEAMDLLAAGFNSNNEISFAIVVIPYSEDACEPGIFHHFSAYQEFQDALDLLECDQGANEPSWDAVYMAAEDMELYDIEASINAPKPVYSKLGWREDAIHVIIMFTDETGQSWENNDRGWCESGPNNEQVMCSVIDTEVFAVITLEDFVVEFDECADTYLFAPTAEELYQQMQGIFGSVCDGL